MMSHSSRAGGEAMLVTGNTIVAICQCVRHIGCGKPACELMQVSRLNSSVTFN